jgi:hypothetical protein
MLRTLATAVVCAVVRLQLQRQPREHRPIAQALHVWNNKGSRLDEMSLHIGSAAFARKERIGHARSYFSTGGRVLYLSRKKTEIDF